MPTLPCEVCGQPIKIGLGNTRIRYHPACKKFRNYLEAAVRAVKEMDPKPTDEAARKIRREAFVAQCRISASVQDRDALGRFR